MNTSLHSAPVWTRKIMIWGAVAMLAFAPLQKTEAAPIAPPIVAIFALEWTQITNLANNLWGNVENLLEWADQKMGMLDQLVELIENNVLTKAIRGFNELMTAIQTDISDVLGTVETLLDAPSAILDTFSEIAGIPQTLIGMVSSLGSEFKGIYDEAMGVFSMVADAQSLGKDFTGVLDSAGGTYGFMNKISGLRTKSNVNFLKGSTTRQQTYKKWGKSNYGNDQIQISSTQTDIALEALKQAVYAEEQRAQDRVYQTAQEMDVDTQQRARAGRVSTATRNWYRSQLRF